VTEIIERVARALANTHYNHVGGADADTLVNGKPNWVFCMQDARAAVEAMREPTEAMLADVERCPAHWDLDGRDGPAMKVAVVVDRVVTAGKWRQMIDAALKEPTA
jgi:hypothetical protein